MTTLYITHEDCLGHATPVGHPERPDRLRAVWERTSGPDFDALKREEAQEASPDMAELAHPASYVDRIRAAAPKEGLVRVDADTSMSPGSWRAVMLGVGAAVRGVDAVLGKEADNVFCATRPPGHHAERTTAMGFCLFNNAAIAAYHAREQHGLKRVAVVDFDVHHGNGTQDIFWSDRDMFYGSTHQMPLYPGTGAVTETGVGNIFNAPLRPGAGGDHFRLAMEERILPALSAFSPELLIVSAGFDAHRRDPLAELNFVEEDFAWATRRLMEVADEACEGRVVSILEGGYDLEGLASSAAAHVRELMRA
ncbi:MAG: histone deacetylase family protein [Flavobacteriaceae bacterium]